MANEKNLKPFKKGQSGNPGGRPKWKQITEILKSEDNQDKLTEVVNVVYEKALSGDMRAVEFIAVLIAGENKEETDNAKIASGESKKCPDCAELIKIEAKVCKHCGKKLTLSKEEKDVIASRIDYYACDCGAINNEMNVGIVGGKCKSKVIGRKNNLDATGPMK